MELNLYNLVGKRFEYGGRGPNTFDCYGLCMEVYKRLGRELPDYPTSFGDVKVDHDTYWFGKKNFVRLKTPEPFCLITFMIYKPFVSHIGVVLEDCLRFINISYKRDVCIEFLDSPRWRNRIDGFWRYEKN